MSEKRFKQKSIFGDKLDYYRYKCGDCKYLYIKHSYRRKFFKCDRKPRGFGYDLTLKHEACDHFRLKIDLQKLHTNRIKTETLTDESEILIPVGKGKKKKQILL